MYIHKIELLNTSLKLRADKYNVGIAQIPVVWAIDKDTLPIIGVTKERYVADAVRAKKMCQDGGAEFINASLTSSASGKRR